MKFILPCLIGLALVASATPAFSQTVVATHGRLRTSGNKIVDKNGAPVSLAGSSLFWSIPGWGGDKYWNNNVVNFLKNDWKSTIVRAPMGVEDGGGYIQNPTANKALMKTVVDSCIANGVYVIIDWHSHYANQYQSQAVAFFTEMAQTYGGYDNVIYEIWNEPVGTVSWPNTVKPYAQAVIAAIRAKDPDNLIIVGSPDWSTDVHVAAADPINDPNVAYSFHFYAASHFAAHRADAQAALNLGKALFITEWGTCASNGAGSVNTTSTTEWTDWMRANKLSHCNWAINDKAETASALKAGASTSGGWTDANLTTSGLLVRGLVRGWNAGGTYQAESLARTAYGATASVITDSAASNGSWIKLDGDSGGDYVQFTVPVTAGARTISFRYKTDAARAKCRLRIVDDNSLVGSEIDQYGTAATYKTSTIGSKTFTVTGNKTFRFEVSGRNAANTTGYTLSIDSITVQ